MNDGGLHELLGAYLLGGLEPAEAAAFEQHLAVCADCRQELDELASLPALLDAVPVPDAVALTAAAAAARDRALVRQEPVPVPRRLLDELARRRRTVRRRWIAAVGGAAAACLALGILAGPLLNQPAKPDASYSVTASSGLEVTVGLAKKTWGTELAVDARSLPVDGTLSLWVKDRDGGEDRACAWTATPTGKVRITGATPVQLAKIASVEMRNEQQQTVAVIAVPQG
ncbi:Putative zinc-finger [Arthrobacter sp. ok909]|uniref:anti-sigma factor family protein n=1 Tax=Arthrobacter sp. ok909 TaxID=1761746 RepID=UPI000886E386|nr:zf-HC2 domain-containing protein [Arthrobacter sp. ok909]SDP46324.1 Putative zinc-finger [Arthrobacter sp. ok909]